MRIRPLTWLLLLAAIPLVSSAMPLHEDLVERLRQELGPDASFLLDIDVPTFSARDVGKDAITISGMFPASVSGTKHPCVVAIKFPDYSNTYTRTDFQNMLFGTWSSGSAKDYYAEVSYGALTLAGTVYPTSEPWYTSDSTRGYYGYNNGSTYAAMLAKEAAGKADPAVNYADFDDNGDGEVDMFTVIHSGYGREESGNGSDIWSHSWSFESAGIGAYVTNDPWPAHPGQYIIVNSYTIDPERSSYTNHGSMVCIGVFCHEWGHAFGLPDLYSTTGEGNGLGNWSLEASGSWGGDNNSPWKPAHLDAWSKSDLGWVTFRNITYNGTRTIYAVEDSAVAYRVWTDGASGSQFFLVENRQKQGFDTTLTNSGLLIYHVDTALIHNRRGDNRVERYPTYGIDLEDADGLNHVYLGLNRGDQGDPYPGGTNNTSFDSTGTDPDSRNHNGNNTHCGVNTISTSSVSMTAFFYIGPNILQPDNQIKNSWETAYVGDSIYNLDGTDQTKSQVVDPGDTAVYHVRIENDGNCFEPVRLIGTAGGGTAHAAWTVHYYDALTGGIEITSQVTGAGWLTDSLEPGVSTDIRVEVSPDDDAWGFETYDVLVTSVSSTDTSKKDAIKATTTVRDYYQPDNLIKRSDETDYVGDGIYNPDGTDQTKSFIANFWTTVAFHIRIENDSNTVDDYTVTGTGSGSGWTVRYFDALTGGADITGQLTGAGWSTGSMDPDASTEIRVELTGSLNCDTIYEVLVTSTSGLSPNTPKELDAVKGVVIAAGAQPDALIKNPTDTSYAGNDIYNTTGTGQTKEQTLSSGETAVYYLKIQNDYSDDEGNPDVINVRGTAGSSSWTVRYFDALTGGADITTQVTGTGWSTGELNTGQFKEIRVEVTPDASLAEGTGYDVLLTAISTNDPARKDVAKARTTVKEEPGVEEEVPPRSFVLDVVNNMVNFSLPEATDVSLRVFDVTGRIVATLASGSMSAGSYSATWKASSGVYFVKLVTPEFSAVRKVVLLN